MNIEPKPIEPITWDPAAARAQVNELYKAVQSKVNASVQWYVAKKETPKKWSQALRAVAITFLVVGGIAPVFQSAIPDKYLAPVSLTELGYVLLAIGGAAILIDTYAGFSSSWMRYIDAHLKLDAMLHRFELEWAVACVQYDLDPESKKDPAKLLALIEKLRTYAQETGDLVQTETQGWMVEFKSQLALLQKAAQKEKPQAAQQAATPAEEAVGEVNVTVDNYDKVPSPIYLFVDGAPAVQLSAKTGKLRVRPGAREVAAHTFVDGTLKQAGTKTNVVSGSATDVSLTLPV